MQLLVGPHLLAVGKTNRFSDTDNMSSLLSKHQRQSLSQAVLEMQRRKRDRLNTATQQVITVLEVSTKATWQETLSSGCSPKFRSLLEGLHGLTMPLEHCELELLTQTQSGGCLLESTSALLKIFSRFPRPESSGSRRSSPAHRHELQELSSAHYCDNLQCSLCCKTFSADLTDELFICSTGCAFIACTPCLTVSVQKELVTMNNVYLGARVVRGRDWDDQDYGSRDGGAGKAGTVVGFRNMDGQRVGRVTCVEGCCDVDWDYGERSSTHRIGRENSYTLYMATCPSDPAGKLVCLLLL